MRDVDSGIHEADNDTRATETRCVNGTDADVIPGCVEAYLDAGTVSSHSMFSLAENSESRETGMDAVKYLPLEVRTTPPNKTTSRELPMPWTVT
jgi:hypothetical protein